MSEDPETRIKTHNSGKVKLTKHFRPFKLLYMEEAGSRMDARGREKYLKSAAGRKFLDNII